MARLRSDGRGPEQFRPMFLDTKVLSQARGSCYCEIGDTKVMVGVFGPRQSDVRFGFSEHGRLLCEVRCTAFAGGAAGNKQEQVVREKAMAASIVAALEPSVQLDTFPKAVVEVSVCILEAAGGELSACITAACMALADAGIALYDLAPSCSVVRHRGTLLLDPTTSESSSGDAEVHVCVMPSVDEITQLNVTGCWVHNGAADGQPKLNQALQLALGGCMQLRDEMRTVLLEKAGEQKQANGLS